MYLSAMSIETLSRSSCAVCSHSTAITALMQKRFNLIFFVYLNKHTLHFL